MCRHTSASFPSCCQICLYRSTQPWVVVFGGSGRSSGGGGNIHHEHPLKMKFILYIVIGELFQKFFFSFVPLTSSKETFFQKICPK